MVVKMMRWPPWPPSFLSKKFQVKLVVTRLEGLHLNDQDDSESSDSRVDAGRRVTAEVRWKGPKSKSALGTFRRRIVRINCTKESTVVLLDPEGTQEEQKQQRQGEGEIEEEEEQRVEDNNNKRMAKVEWNEEFLNVCTLTSNNNNKDEQKSNFHPWKISFRIFNGLSSGQSNKLSVIGTALLNLAEFASAAENKEIEICIPLSTKCGSAMLALSLRLGLSFLEMNTAQLSFGSDVMPKAVVPDLSPFHQRDSPLDEKDEVSALREGLRRVRMLRDFVSKSGKNNQEDEGSDGRNSIRSDDAEYTYPFDTDSMDEDLENGEEDRKETSNIRKSFSYGTLASANFVGRSFYPEMRTKGKQEDWIYYSHCRSDVGCSHKVEATSATELSSSTTIKRSILPWKRERFFRSPKSKGEPLLKCYREEGGDDIDFDRRQLSSDESLGGPKLDEDTIANRLSSSDFGDDNFVIGSWETKEVVSRDGRMKLCSQVFFATIDQRSERAAGESACTALVAVIANWFQGNLQVMPIKSQFDGLIREGSLEWRNLCENETYRQRFPDKHFDLETVILAKIRPLTIVASKSFIGFFHPDVVKDDEGNKNTDNKSNVNCFEFLDGAMSFDSIWDEISRAAIENKPSNGSPHIYIVSWNDHFFILKVECDAYYIIDTLGERLYEGCDQAYILMFDEDTSIRKMRADDKSSTGNQKVRHNAMVEKELPGEEANNNDDDEIVCKGKESCKEYIKNFLAAIPIRELQVDMKKGLLSSTPVHHRLQIEFHYTQFSNKGVEEVLTQETEVAKEITGEKEILIQETEPFADPREPIEPQISA